jgi:hypothetical protein
VEKEGRIREEMREKRKKKKGKGKMKRRKNEKISNLKISGEKNKR